MKTFIASSFLFGALLAGAAVADTKPVPQYTVIKTKLESMQQAFPQKAPSVRDFEDIRGEIKRWDRITAERRQHLEHAVEDLILRAQSRYLDVMDLLIVRQRVVDALLDQYLDELAEQAKSRSATRDQWNLVVAVLDERVALELTPPDLRTKLVEEVDRLKERFKQATPTPIGYTDVAMVADAAARLSLDRALFWLMERAEARHATREQFDYAKEILERRARIWYMDTEFAQHVAYMQRRIDGLVDRALRCEMSRDEVQALYDEFMRRARLATQ